MKIATATTSSGPSLSKLSSLKLEQYQQLHKISFCVPVQVSKWQPWLSTVQVYTYVVSTTVLASQILYSLASNFPSQLVLDRYWWVSIWNICVNIIRQFVNIISQFVNVIWQFVKIIWQLCWWFEFVSSHQLQCHLGWEGWPPSYQILGFRVCSSPLTVEWRKSWW